MAKTNKIKITIMTPKGATTNTELGLVHLTEVLTNKVFKGEWQGGGVLGGMYGYGVNYENDTFMMHPFCWCEKDDCGWCCGDNPNFLYKPTDCKIQWYKYIGRSQEQKGSLPKDWLKKCLESITPIKVGGKKKK